MSDDGTITCIECGATLPVSARFCEHCSGPSQPVAGSDEDDEGQPKPLNPGDVLDGKWRIERKLGVGGMSSVFLAHDLALDRKVAVKALAPALCNDTVLTARFEREARATARLEHPNIVPVYGVGRHFGQPFIVMKKLTGKSLGYWIGDRANQSLRPQREEVLSILRQLCAGLGFIHENGFVHRDLKPGNIHVGLDGHTTILDFGVLRDPSSSQNLTRAGNPLGTPHYMAPEQATGASNLDQRADLYSVGAVLYEILSGAPPFDGPTPLDVMRMHTLSPPPDVCKAASWVPAAVSEAIRTAMAKRPEDRFQTAQELYSAVEAAWAAPSKLTPPGETPAARTNARPSPHDEATPPPLLEEAPPVAVAIAQPPATASLLETSRESALEKAKEAMAEEPLALSLSQPQVRRAPRPLPQQAPIPEMPDDDLSLPDQAAARKRKLFIMALVAETLLVISVLAWALWPTAPGADPIEPAAAPESAGTSEPTISKPKAPKAALTRPVPPPTLPLEQIKPPEVDFKPPEAGAPPSSAFELKPTQPTENGEAGATEPAAAHQP
ncbi:MAG: protein kinase [Deltaproteobacteria bacterium]|nr:protein kinase [Deltaproteobacteria bacterium]